VTVLALVAAAAVPAAAQYAAPKMNQSPSGAAGAAVGEKYHIQVSGDLWKPTVHGVIASSQFGLAGTEISFEDDLKFEPVRFKEVAFELRVTKRNKFYAQYTPITYTSAPNTTLGRSIVFNGQTYAVNVPIEATYDWKVWRLGYEIDVVSMSRGFVGLMFEAKMTDFGASIISPAVDEPQFTRAKGPLPALGLIARAYPLPNLSLTGQITGIKVPDISPDYQGSYADWNVYGTYNINNFIGVQGGWRRLTTNVVIKKDSGNTEFKGIWFGAVVRY
jgi:hypothetical protein